MTTLLHWGPLSVLELFWILVSGITTTATLPAVLLSAWAGWAIRRREEQDGYPRPLQRRAGGDNTFARTGWLQLHLALLALGVYSGTRYPAGGGGQTDPVLIAILLYLCYAEVWVALAAVRTLRTDVAFVGGWRALWVLLRNDRRVLMARLRRQPPPEGVQALAEAGSLSAPPWYARLVAVMEAAGIVVDTYYLNRTANKDPRPPGTTVIALLWHETQSPHPTNAKGTLEFNLAPGLRRGQRGSYNMLIGYDGILYLYLDWERWIAWSAGNSAALGFQDFDVSVHTLGIEVDSRGDGTPPTPAQWRTMLAVTRWAHTELGIPIDVAHHLQHKDIARPKGRKKDPAGFTTSDLVQRALATTE